MQRRMCDARGGFGIVLILVLAIIFVVAAGALAQGTFSQSVLRGTAKTIVGQQAQHIAEDALTEAHFFLGLAINSPEIAGGLYFRLFREFADEFTTTIPLSELTATESRLQQFKDYLVVGDEVRVRIVGQQPTSHANPTEHSRCGIMVLRVVVRHRKSRVVRKLRQSYEFTVSLTALPRPLDRATAFVKEGDKLVDGSGYPANSLIEESNEKMEDVAAAVDKFIEGYEEALQKVQGSAAVPQDVVSLLRETKRICEECKASLEAPVNVVSGNKEIAQERSVHLYPRHSYSLVSFEDELPLELLELPKRLRQCREDMAVAQEREREALAQLESYAASKPEKPVRLPSLQRSWCAAAAELNTLAKVLLLDEMRAFQLKIKPLSFKAMQSLEGLVRSFTLEDWHSRATMVFSSSEEFSEFKEQREVCSGVFVINGDGEFVVEGTFSGRSVIVVAGDCRVKSCLVMDKASDTVTVVVFGRLQIDGPVDGSLVAWGDLESSQSCAVSGSLLMRDVMGFGEVEMKGTLRRDERLLAGPARTDGLVATVDGKHQYVNVAPTQLAAKISR